MATATWTSNTESIHLSGYPVAGLAVFATRSTRPDPVLETRKPGSKTGLKPGSNPGTQPGFNPVLLSGFRVSKTGSGRVGRVAKNGRTGDRVPGVPGTRDTPSLAGNSLELAGKGKPELQATAIRSKFSG